MKNVCKLFGFLVLAAVIGFSMTTCDNGSTGTNTKIEYVYINGDGDGGGPFPYVITGINPEFTATKGGVVIGTAVQPIQVVIDAIRADAAGKACEIQFGWGETLDFVGNFVEFNNIGGTWGVVTLSGKILATLTHSMDGKKGTITVAAPVFVNSKANITNTSTYASATVLYNTGTVTISGGTLLGGRDGVAIYNDGGGTATISGGTVSSGNNGTAISNWGTGTIIISGGTVSAQTGPAVGNYSTAEAGLIITGGTVSSTNRVAVDNVTGGVIISGGTVQSTGATRGAVSNETGKITVTGTAMVTSVNTQANSGTIMLEFNTTATDVKLQITGGTVENTATGGNAIYNDTVGGINISGGTVRATGAGGSSIVNSGGGTVTITGGTITPPYP